MRNFRYHNMNTYLNMRGVVIVEKKIPHGLRSLLPLAEEWCVLGDTELEKKVKNATTEKLRTVVDTCEPLFAELQEYCSSCRDKITVPHEVALFQVFRFNYLTVRSELWVRQSEG